MKLSAPKQITFLISLVLFVLAVIGKFVAIPFISANLFWVLVVSEVILLIGCAVKGF